MEDLVRCPNTAGTYVMLAGKEVVYVGQSKTLQHRLLNGHGMAKRGLFRRGYARTPWGMIDQFEIAVRFDRRRGERLMREDRLIHRLRPICNRTSKAWGLASWTPLNRPISYQ